jgi:hypothetical protein
VCSSKCGTLQQLSPEKFSIRRQCQKQQDAIETMQPWRMAPALLAAVLHTLRICISLAGWCLAFCTTGEL